MFPSLQPRNREDGFTMVEILVTVAIIAILAGIAVPMYIGRAQDGYVTNLQTDVGQTATAMSEYYQTNNKWPEAAGGKTASQIFDDQIKVLTKDSGNVVKGYTYSAAQTLNVNADQYDAVIPKMACIQGTNTTKISDPARQTWSYYFTPFGAVTMGTPENKIATTMRRGPCNTTGVNSTSNEVSVEVDGLIADTRQGITGWGSPTVLD